MYFRLASIPELADLPPHERRLVYHACLKRMRRRPFVIACSVTGLLIGAAAGAGILWLFLEFKPFGTLMNFFAAGLPWGVLMVTGYELGRTFATLNLLGPYARELTQRETSQPEDNRRDKIEIDYLREPFEESHAGKD